VRKFYEVLFNVAFAALMFALGFLLVCVVDDPLLLVNLLGG
jgi:hypothetical protein